MKNKVKQNSCIVFVFKQIPLFDKESLFGSKETALKYKTTMHYAA